MYCKLNKTIHHRNYVIKNALILQNNFNNCEFKFGPGKNIDILSWNTATISFIRKYYGYSVPWVYQYLIENNYDKYLNFYNIEMVCVDHTFKNFCRYLMNSIFKYLDNDTNTLILNLLRYFCKDNNIGIKNDKCTKDLLQYQAKNILNHIIIVFKLINKIYIGPVYTKQFKKLNTIIPIVQDIINYYLIIKNGTLNINFIELSKYIQKKVIQLKSIIGNKNFLITNVTFHQTLVQIPALICIKKKSINEYSTNIFETGQKQLKIVQNCVSPIDYCSNIIKYITYQRNLIGLIRELPFECIGTNKYQFNAWGKYKININYYRELTVIHFLTQFYNYIPKNKTINYSIKLLCNKKKLKNYILKFKKYLSKHFDLSKNIKCYTIKKLCLKKNTYCIGDFIYYFIGTNEFCGQIIELILFNQNLKNDIIIIKIQKYIFIEYDGCAVYKKKYLNPNNIPIIQFGPTSISNNENNFNYITIKNIVKKINMFHFCNYNNKYKCNINNNLLKNKSFGIKIDNHNLNNPYYCCTIFNSSHFEKNILYQLFCKKK